MVLNAEHLRVDRLHEGVHSVETFGSRAGRQPFEIAVRTREGDAARTASHLQGDSDTYWLVPAPAIRETLLRAGWGVVCLAFRGQQLKIRAEGSMKFCR